MTVRVRDGFANGTSSPSYVSCRKHSAELSRQRKPEDDGSRRRTSYNMLIEPAGSSAKV